MRRNCTRNPSCPQLTIVFQTNYYEETSVKIANFHKVPAPMSTRLYCVGCLYENEALHVITDDVECIPCAFSVKKIESLYKGVIVKDQ